MHFDFDAEPDEYLDSLFLLCSSMINETPITSEEDLLNGWVAIFHSSVMRENRCYVAGILADTYGRDEAFPCPFLHDGDSIRFENPTIVPNTVRNRLRLACMQADKRKGVESCSLPPQKS